MHKIVELVDQILEPADMHIFQVELLARRDESLSSVMYEGEVD